MHEFEAASKKRRVKKLKEKKKKGRKKEKGEEVNSDMFPGLLFVFDVFSRSQVERSKCSPGCGALFPWLAGTPSG